MAIQRAQPRAMRQWIPSMMEEMERLMNEAFWDWPFRTIWRRLPSTAVSWMPALDMYEKADSFIIRMELPGVDKKDVDISITGDTLTIKGERKPMEEIKDEEYELWEMRYGSFTRSITLPAPVNADKVEASYDNGILEIKLPKAKEAMSARIEIKAKG